MVWKHHGVLSFPLMMAECSIPEINNGVDLPVAS